MNEYDISLAFEEIEYELIKKLRKQMMKYIPNGSGEMTQRDWNRWQVECLKALEQFKRENKKLFEKEYNKINKEIEQMLKEEYSNGFIQEEKRVLEAIKNGAKLERQGHFFGIDSRKLNSLLFETKNLMLEREHSILRNLDDIYRKTIFSSQVYFQSGAGTLWDAVDMATSKFMSNGITTIQYKNGANVNIASYSEMALRTANVRAKNYGEGDLRDEWGTHLVLVSEYGACSETCLPWQGRIYLDDVYSTPTKDEYSLGYELLSTAIANGLYHPNCRHSHTTYYEGISEKKELDKSTKEISETYKNEQIQRYNERQIRKYKKQEALAMTDNAKAKYSNKVKEWQAIQRQHIKEHKDMLRRDYQREKVRVK